MSQRRRQARLNFKRNDVSICDKNMISKIIDDNEQFRSSFAIQFDYRQHNFYYASKNLIKTFQNIVLLKIIENYKFSLNVLFKEALVKDVIIIFIFIIISQSSNATFFMFINFFVIFEDFEGVVLSI